MQMPTLYTWLGLLGLVPFLTGMTGTLLGYEVLNAFIVYSAVILSFLAGSLWGQSFQNERTNSVLQLASNFVAIVVWLAVWLASTKLVMLVLAVGFISLYTIERSQAQWLANNMPVNYYRLRFALTVVVVSCHAVLFLFV